MIRFQTIREQVGNAQAGAARAFAFSVGRPSLLGRFVSVVVVLLLALIAIVVIIPVVLILILVGLAVLVYFRIQVWLTRARQPNGTLDGRRNVRVREHSTSDAPQPPQGE